MRILTVNAGSSSVKVAVIEDGRRVKEYAGLPAEPPSVDAVGHRIVHGGTEFVRPVIVSPEVEARLRALADLAPLHQPKSLDALDAARSLLPDVPHVACFDTAFHAGLPAAASTYALPAEWRQRWPLRKFGFHGLSHSWASRRAIEIVPGARRVVVCHLGAGASLAAVLDGRSVDTTMGFTPLDGLVMATRSGSVDPGLLTWLEEHEGLSPHEIAEALEHRSGLLGLSGTADMSELLAREDHDARLAVDVYVHRLASAIGSMVVALRGLDVLVFTGGVGENAPEIRRRTAEPLAHLGINIDPDLNEAAQPDCAISPSGAPTSALVIAAREDLEIATSTEHVLGHGR